MVGVGLSLCHDVSGPDPLPALCGPPPALPRSAAAIEAELRNLFDQIATSGGVPFRYRSGPSPGSDYVECSDALSCWILKFFNENGGDNGTCKWVENLVAKVMDERIAKMKQDGGIMSHSHLKGGDELMDASKVPAAALNRKQQEPLLEMLMWIRGVATDPCDSRASGMLQEWRNLNLNSQQQALSPTSTNSWSVDGFHYLDKIMYWRKMAFSSREALFQRVTDKSSNTNFPFRKRQKLHRLLHEASRDPATIIRQNGASCSYACSDPSLLDECYSAECSVPTDWMIGQPRRSQRSLGLPKNSKGNGLRKRVPIGTLFQADVPEWTGPLSNRPVSDNDENLSDSRWLGKQIWPLKDNDQESNNEMIGNRMTVLCSCQSPRSVDCIRYHISAARFRLRYELGQAFYSLGLDDMGEEVSRSWTWEEQMIFDTLVKLNPVSEYKSFWEPALNFFSHKSRQNIASYYFNVFVLRRMSIQTRLEGRNVDSDDDEVGRKAHGVLYPRTSRRRYSKRKP